MTNIVATQKTYFVFPSIAHHGIVEAGQNITSTHTVETFTDEKEYINRITQLGLITDDNDDTVPVLD